MKRRQKLAWSNIVVLITISILLGNGSIVLGQQRIDKVFMVNPNITAETIRTISIKPTNSDDLSLFIGTNKGKILSAQFKSNSESSSLNFQPFSIIPQTDGLIMDIQFVSEDEGYLLKDDGLYFNDGRTASWKQIASVKTLPPSPGAIPELWSMSFLNDSKACIAGVYLKNNSDRDIDKELFLCTENIKEKPIKWKKTAPQNRTSKQLHITNVNFADSQNGWAVGTEGTVWVTNNGGRLWEEQNTKFDGAFLSVFGFNNNEAWAVGSSGAVYNKKVNSGETTNNSIIKEKDTVIIKNETLQRIIKDEVLQDIIEEDSLNTIILKLPEIKGIVKKVDNPNKPNKLTIELLPDTPNLKNWIRNTINDYLRTNKLGVSDVKPENEKTSISAWEKVEDEDLSKLTEDLSSIKFVSSDENEQFGWIIGDKGTILYTENGGKNWKPVTTTNLPKAQKDQLANVNFYSMAIDGNYCWVVGSKGTIVRIKYKQ